MCYRRQVVWIQFARVEHNRSVDELQGVSINYTSFQLLIVFRF